MKKNELSLHQALFEDFGFYKDRIVAYSKTQAYTHQDFTDSIKALALYLLKEKEIKSIAVCVENAYTFSIVFIAAGIAADPDIKRMAQFVHHLRRQFDRIAALLVDADTGVAAQEPFDRQFVARQRALRHFVRPRDLHVLAAAGGYVTGRAAHIVQTDHALCGEILISEFRCADEAGLFLHGEDALQRRMRQCIIVEKCHHSSGGCGSVSSSRNAII